MLELACGTGRVTVPLAQRASVDVVGVDIDRAMLASARARGARSIVCADMRTFAFGRRFPLIAIPYNSLQLLDDAGQRACLARVTAALAPGGTFAVEVADFQSGAAVLEVPPEPIAEGRLEGGEHVVLTGSLEHDPATRTSIYRRWFDVDGARIDDAVVIRSLDAGEVRALLTANGYDVVSLESVGVSTRVVATPSGR